MEFHLKKKLDDSSHFYSEKKSRIFKEKSTNIHIWKTIWIFPLLNYSSWRKARSMHDIMRFDEHPVSFNYFYAALGSTSRKYVLVCLMLLT